MRKPLMILLALVALLGAACGGDADPGDGTPAATDPATDEPTDDPGDCEDVTGESEVTIEMTDNAFSPDCLTYAPVPVKFVNSGAVEHNFSIAGTAATVDIEAGSESTVDPHVWDTPGEYTFFCKYHGSEDGSGMAGTLTIVEA